MTIVKGDKREFTVTVLDGDKNAFNLTGYAMEFTAKRAVEQTDGDADIAATAVVDTPANGIGVFTLTPTKTRVDVRDYLFDVQISDSGSNVFTVIPKTTLTITEEITIDE